MEHNIYDTLNTQLWLILTGCSNQYMMGLPFCIQKKNSKYELVYNIHKYESLSLPDMN